MLQKESTQYVLCLCIVASVESLFHLSDEPYPVVRAI
jgi:hypothetical protein